MLSRNALALFSSHPPSSKDTGTHGGVLLLQRALPSPVETETKNQFLFPGAEQETEVLKAVVELECQHSP